MIHTPVQAALPKSKQMALEEEEPMLYIILTLDMIEYHMP